MMERERDLERYETQARTSAYGGNLSAPTPRTIAPSGVLYQIDTLEKLLAEAHSLVDRLSTRVEPITESGPECPRNTLKDRDPPMEGSQVGQRLEQATTALRELCGRIDALTNRIRL